MRGHLPGRKSVPTLVAGILLGAVALGSCAADHPPPPDVRGPASCASAMTGAGGRDLTRTSTGAAAALVDVLLEVAPSAPADRPLPVRTTLSIKGDGPRVILRTKGSALLLERRGVVVARSELPTGHDVPLMLRVGARHPSQVLPDAFVLTSCDAAALGPGDYSLRALVAYGADPLNSAADGGPAGVLVSPAIALVLT